MTPLRPLSRGSHMTTSMHGARRPVLGLVAIVFVLQTSGCYSWNPVPAPTPQDVFKHGAVYEVSTVDRRKWRLKNVRIRNDSLVGVLRKPSYGEPGLSSTTLGVPTAMIAAIKVGKLNLGRTIIGLVVSAVGLLALLGALIAGGFEQG